MDDDVRLQLLRRQGTCGRLLTVELGTGAWSQSVDAYLYLVDAEGAWALFARASSTSTDDCKPFLVSIDHIISVRETENSKFPDRIDVSADPSVFFGLLTPTEAVSEEVVLARRARIEEYLEKSGVAFETCDDGTLLVSQALVINSPYTPESCESENSRLLTRIRRAIVALEREHESTRG